MPSKLGETEASGDFLNSNPFIDYATKRFEQTGRRDACWF
jgi:hypothetical protein